MSLIFENKSATKLGGLQFVKYGGMMHQNMDFKASDRINIW